MNLDKVVGSEIYRGDLKIRFERRKKLVVWGLASEKIFHNHAHQIVGKRPNFGNVAMKEAEDQDRKVC